MYEKNVSMTRLMTVILITFHLPCQADSFRILLYPFGHCINSHLLNMEKLAKVLQQVGHHVTLLVPNTYKGPYSNVHLDPDNVDYIYYVPPEDTKAICHFHSLEEYLQSSLIQIAKKFYSSTMAHCESLLQQKKVLLQIKKINYDLAIYDAVDYCSKILADYIDRPFIIFHTHGMENVYPRHPAYHPSLLTTYSHQMNLLQRVVNTFTYIVQQGIITALTHNYQALRVKYHMNASLDIRDSFSRAPVRLILGNHGLDYVAPMHPGNIMVGGTIHSDPQSLPTDMTEFMDGDQGIILVSFGTMIKTYDVTWRETFASSLARLPYKVIWKYNGERPSTLGNNTLLLPWVPQKEVLSHPNMRAFVTHCGWNSMMEAANQGIPVVAVPLFGDQFFQATKLTEHAQMGVKLDIRSLTSDQLYNAIMQVTADRSYKFNAVKVSAIIKTQPVSQKELISYWVNYVIQFKGAQHLANPGNKLYMYQYLLLDVVLIYLVIIFITVLIIRYAFSYIYRAVSACLKYCLTSDFSNSMFSTLPVST